MPRTFVRWTLAILSATLAVGLLYGGWHWRDEIYNWYEARLGRRPLLNVVTWHYQLDRIEESLPQLAANTADCW